MPADKRKQTGAHFTPPSLAGLVAERLAERVCEMRGPIRILDPACGDGSLLVAMARSLREDVRGRCTLVGIEHDPSALDSARRELDGIRAHETDLVLGDFLDFADDGTLFGSRRSMDPVDVIIANPPYVRTQVLGAEMAQSLAERFGLVGRVDLYQAFLVAMTQQLRPGGLLGVITSNRFLTTRAGASTRHFLRTRFELLEVVDLGDTKLFEAAVLPALVFGIRRDSEPNVGANSSPRFVRIYEDVTTQHGNATAAASVVDVLRQPRTGRHKVRGTVFHVAVGQLVLPHDPARPWTMLTRDEQDVVARVDDRATLRVRDVAKVRVGIKTTADDVFIRGDWGGLPHDIRPEKDYLRPLLSQREAARWRPALKPSAARRVLYTHESFCGRRRPIHFPSDSCAWQYLLAHRERLESREYVMRAGREWYEIWVPQDPAAWAQPKIVFPDISPEARFFLDRAGSIVDGNCYWITANDPSDDDLLLLILGVANSALMARYHELCFQNKLYSQRRRYLTQYVQEYPLPDPRQPACAEIVAATRELTSDAVHGDHQRELEARIDSLVFEAFGLSLASSTGTAG
jgi:tRNA1(Val) A37 N6-methylase TrmN6